MLRLKILLGHLGFWSFLAAALASLANTFTCWTLGLYGSLWIFVFELVVALFAAGWMLWVIRKRYLHMVRELAYGLVPVIMVAVMAICGASAWFMWNWIGRQNDGPWIAVLGGLIICGYHSTRLLEVRYLPELDQLR